MKKLKLTRKHLILNLAALGIGLLASVFIFNLQQDKLIQFDVTWNTPQEAMIFWKTSSPVKGYIKYGVGKYQLNQTQPQLNDHPSELHVVILKNLPPEEIFISLHNETDRFFRWPKAVGIKYEPKLND